MAGMGEDVYCTLLMSDSYLPGAAVLANSLRDAGTKKKLACLITLDTLSADTITELKELYDYLIPVERIANPHPANLYSMQRPDLLFAFTKIALWRQTQFRKIVYIDADIVALRAPDELFNITAPFAAAPDIGWPDAFNSGVMVISPNMGDYWALQTLAASGDSFDGADQGLLNQYYEHRGWERISFTYNCTPNAEYQWEPAYRYYKSKIAMVHFIGTDKPWIKGRQVRGPGVYNDLLSRWWAVHDRHQKSTFTQQSLPARSASERYVEGESTTTGAAQAVPSEPPPPPQEAPPTTIEETLSEPGERAEDIDQGREQPIPTVEQGRFSAPQMQWDATRSEPPPESKPEAANFPSQTYGFSESRQLFQPPTSYPEPPKDMWYQVPEAKPVPQVAPPPIFPWERERAPQRATRVFVEDLPPPESPSTPTLTLTPTREEGDSRSTTPTPQEIVQEDPIVQQPFSPTQNAWDNVAGIERYVRAVLGAQNKAKPIAPTMPAGLEGMGVISPTEELLPPGSGSGGQTDRQRRKSSLILTDFPSAVERPSLPVTPAPIRRPTFWGEERDEGGNLPAAEGVPDQIDWVCPSCGFVGDDVTAFARVRTRTAASRPEGSGKEKEREELDLEPLPEPEPMKEITPGLKQESEAVLPAAVDAPKLPKELKPENEPLPDPPVTAEAAQDVLDLPGPSDAEAIHQHHSNSMDSNFSAASTVVAPSLLATAGPPGLQSPPKPENTGPFWMPSYAPLRSDLKGTTTVNVPEEAVVSTPPLEAQTVEDSLADTQDPPAPPSDPDLAFSDGPSAR